MKNRSHRLKSRQEHKYTKYKLCLSIMIVPCVKQHLSNIGSTIHENGWVDKKRCL